MSDLVRQKLAELIVRFGDDVCDDPKRCEAFLRDFCGGHRREIFVLVSAVREGIGNELRDSSVGTAKEVLLARMAKRLHENCGVEEKLARWAVESWALALGKANASDFRFPFKCPGCGASGNMPRRIAGQQTNCPNCKSLLRISDDGQRISIEGTPRAGASTNATTMTNSLGAGASTNTRTMTNSLGMDLVLIPAGKFRMGSLVTEMDRRPNEAQVDVTLSSAFYLGITVVTQGQWSAVMGTTPWTAPWSKNLYPCDGDKFPATDVSWQDAQAFCKKLSQKESGKYRLPTEAEWEYACRGETTTRFSFGDEDSALSDYAWWGGYAGGGNVMSEKSPHEVGLKHANPFGLYDMHGNVWEWCEDVYMHKLPGGTDPLVSAGDSFRVRRGGNWAFFASNCRSAARNCFSRSARDHDLGFRVAWNPSGK